MSEQAKSKRWIVRYRRYSSDEWLEESFPSKGEALKFQRDYLYDRGFEAQAEIREYVEVER